MDLARLIPRFRPPAFIENEKKTWVNHKLQCDPEIRKVQLDLLGHFGETLRLGSRQEKFYTLSYWHFFITDGTWVIEFGGGDLASAGVNVHSNPIQDFKEEAKFAKTPEVIVLHSPTFQKLFQGVEPNEEGVWGSLLLFVFAKL